MNAWNGLLADRTTALVLMGLSARWESVDQELRALSTQLRSSVFWGNLKQDPWHLKSYKTYKECSSVKLVKIPGGSSSILFFCRYLQEQVILTYFMTRMDDSYTNLRQKNAWCQQQQQHKLYLHNYMCIAGFKIKLQLILMTTTQWWQWSIKCHQYDLITNYYVNHYIRRQILTKVNSEKNSVNSSI